ncbi:V-type ATP synthase subunit F [Desulfogranum mediterraneum]|uniref:V-type ATP synthase subunit F n=1 Tax=Desulfogranum mediterraneum TaxID=160661 RepID=UPI0003FA8F21|nr:V-type ATP synthase subunit F [Desulfogranum mediterraneum]
MQILVIADHTTCLAFSLGGIMTRPVKGREEVLAALESARGNQQIGLVLITEKMAALVRPEVEKILYAMHLPLVVTIPDSAGPLSARRSAKELMVSLMSR